MEKGYLSLVLHAHLPYVRHPEHDDFLEEDWFFEAVTETYIPLLRTFQRLASEGVAFRVTMSLTPPLLSMFADGLLQERYARHMRRLIEFTSKEAERTQWQPEFNQLALMYHHRFTETLKYFEEQYQRNLVTPFRELQDGGQLEIVTCGATHGFLPLMNMDPGAVRGQIHTAVDHYQRMLGRRPRGIWLPECGYAPGIDEVLKDCGIEYFLVDSHGVWHATPRPKYGVFAPIFCPSGVAAFARDLESSKQVWSAKEGYPGDTDYREFYRDAGYDLEYDYVRPYLHADGVRRNIGVKYYRITGPTKDKKAYDPHLARERAAEHAGNFMFNREKQIEHLASLMDRRPMIVAPYDAELFGHWWFEGPEFIEFLIRKMHHDQSTVKLATPGDYLDAFPVNQVATPSMSSWGHKGYSEVWLEGSNDWIYRHLHIMAERMHGLARDHAGANGLVERALKQAARELLLAQSSDWAFIMKTGTMVEYAVKRTNDHIARFNWIHDAIRNQQIDEPILSDIESKDNIFPDIDYRVYA